MPPERRMRRTGANIAASIAGQLIGKVSTLAWTLVAARELSATAFGAFFYAYALAGLASAVAEWGFDPVLVENASRDPSVVDRAYTRAQAAQTVIAIPAFTVAAVVAAQSRGDVHARVAVVLVCAAVLLDLWTDTARTVGVAVRNQVPTAEALIVQRGVTAVGAIVTLALGGGLLGLCAAFLGGSVVGVASHVRALRHLGVRLVRGNASPRVLWATFRDCATLGVTVVVMMALFRLDAVLLGVIKGSAAVARYGVAYRLFEATLFLTYSVQGATFATMAAATRAEDVGREVSRGFAVAGCVYAGFLGVCLADSPGVLKLLYGSTYVHVSAGALEWLGAAPLCYLAASLTFSALQAVRRRRAILVAAVVALVVNVALNLALIPSTGGTGAAFATTASYALMAAAALVALHRAGVRVGVVRAAAAPVATAAAVTGGLLALRLPTVAEVPIVVGVVGAAWGALLVRRRPPWLRRLIHKAS